MVGLLLVALLTQQPRPDYGFIVTYPELLRQARVEGRVVIRALVDTSGRVVPESTRILSSTHAGFDQVVKRAALSWGFYRLPQRAPVTVDVVFLMTSRADYESTGIGTSCDHCDRESEGLRKPILDHARIMSTCGRVLERWSNVDGPEQLTDTLLSVLQCEDAPSIAPFAIRLMSRDWDGDTAKTLTVASMGYRFRTADALLVAARMAEDASLGPAGRVYAFQVLSVLVHPRWVWRLSPDGGQKCDRVMILSTPPDPWGDSWPEAAEVFARGVADRTLAQRSLPGPVRTAATCLLDLFQDR